MMIYGIANVINEKNETKENEFTTSITDFDELELST